MCAPLHYVLYGQENPYVYEIYKGKNGLARPLRGFLTQMEVQTGTDSFRSAFIYINWDLRGGGGYTGSGCHWKQLSRREESS